MALPFNLHRPPRHYKNVLFYPKVELVAQILVVLIALQWQYQVSSLKKEQRRNFHEKTWLTFSDLQNKQAVHL